MQAKKSMGTDDETPMPVSLRSFVSEKGNLEGDGLVFLPAKGKVLKKARLRRSLSVVRENLTEARAAKHKR